MAYMEDWEIESFYTAPIPSPHLSLVFKPASLSFHKPRLFLAIWSVLPFLPVSFPTSRPEPSLSPFVAVYAVVKGHTGVLVVFQGYELS